MHGQLRAAIVRGDANEMSSDAALILHDDIEVAVFVKTPVSSSSNSDLLSNGRFSSSSVHRKGALRIFVKEPSVGVRRSAVEGK